MLDPRFIDSLDTVAIKPLGLPVLLEAEELDVSLDEYLSSLGLEDEPIKIKKKAKTLTPVPEPQDI